MSQIVQRDYFAQGGVDDAASPLTLPNMGRYTNITFAATTVTKVEGSVDGTTFFDITAMAVASSPTGTKMFQNICFKQYKVTYTGSLFVNAN